MKLFFTYEFLKNELGKLDKPMEDLGRELNIGPAFFEELEYGSVPDDRTIWAISNWFNMQKGRTNICSQFGYDLETRKQLKDMPRQEGVVIPKHLETILVAYSFGDELITQDDIDDLVEANKLRHKE